MHSHIFLKSSDHLCCLRTGLPTRFVRASSRNSNQTREDDAIFSDFNGHLNSIKICVPSTSPHLPSANSSKPTTPRLSTSHNSCSKPRKSTSSQTAMMPHSISVPPSPPPRSILIIHVCFLYSIQTAHTHSKTKLKWNDTCQRHTLSSAMITCGIIAV